MGGMGSPKLGKLRMRGPRAAPRQARLHSHPRWSRFLLKGDNGIDETCGPEGLSCPWGREQCLCLLTNWRRRAHAGFGSEWLRTHVNY